MQNQTLRMLFSMFRMLFVELACVKMTLLLEHFKQMFCSCNSFKQFFLSYLRLKLIIIHFSNVFALASLKIFYILPGHQWSHIVLEYNNENMRLIRLLLANQIAYIFPSDDNILYYIILLLLSQWLPRMAVLSNCYQ